MAYGHGRVGAQLPRFNSRLRVSQTPAGFAFLSREGAKRTAMAGLWGLRRPKTCFEGTRNRCYADPLRFAPRVYFRVHPEDAPRGVGLQSVHQERGT